MKIAFLTTDNRENDRRYDLTAPYFGTAPEALLQGFATLPGIDVHVVSCTQRPMQSPEKIANNIWFHSLHVPKIGWLRTGYLGCIRAARKKLRAIKPDIVHGQGTERDCAISTVFSGFSSVVTVHGCMNAIAGLHHSRIGSFHWLQARIEDIALPRTQGIICISDYVKNLVAKYGTKTWLVPNAIQKMFFDFPKQESEPLKKPLLINVGVISERKRQIELLGVLESLRSEGIDFDTLFVGLSTTLPYSSEFDVALEKAARKHGGFEHVEKFDDPSFCKLYDRASAMIHFSSEESFGLTFAEAIARGLYLFASDVGAVRDIAHGVDRIQIFDLNKWDELKNAVRQWIISGGYQEPHPAKPPQEFIERYHPICVARKHLEIYRSVLENRP